MAQERVNSKVRTRFARNTLPDYKDSPLLVEDQQYSPLDNFYTVPVKNNFQLLASDMDSGIQDATDNRINGCIGQTQQGSVSKKPLLP